MKIKTQHKTKKVETPKRWEIYTILDMKGYVEIHYVKEEMTE